jgi:hypothetical protein
MRFAIGSVETDQGDRRFSSAARVKGDGRGSGFVVRLCDGADIFGLIILLSAVVFPLNGDEQ